VVLLTNAAGGASPAGTAARTTLPELHSHVVIGISDDGQWVLSTADGLGFL